MNSTINIDWYLIFVILGILQALILSVLILIRSRKYGPRFAFLSLFIFSLTIILTEVFLNYSGFIVEAIHFYKFSLPIQFLLAPSIYLFIKLSLHSGKGRSKWIHYIPFLFFLGYFGFYFFQEEAIIFNNYVSDYKLNIEKLPVTANPFQDPIGILKYIHILVFVHLIVYAGLLFNSINRKYSELGNKWFNNNRSYINPVSYTHLTLPTKRIV